jgi:hypothetical protein
MFIPSLMKISLLIQQFKMEGGLCTNIMAISESYFLLPLLLLLLLLRDKCGQERVCHHGCQITVVSHLYVGIQKYCGALYKNDVNALA